VPVLIEWDADIPALSVLQDEANKAEQILQSVRVENHDADIRDDHVRDDHVRKDHVGGVQHEKRIA